MPDHTDLIARLREWNGYDDALHEEAATTLEELSQREARLVAALERVSRAYAEWDPDGSFASTVLSRCSEIARAALTEGGEP